MIVVKAGGGAAVDADAVCDDVAALHAAGEHVVLLHGGNAEMDRVSSALGHPPRFVTSPSGRTSRFTDRRTMEIFQMVYRGKQNGAFVERLLRRSVSAVGLSGLDGRLFEGRRTDTVRSVENGKTKLLRGDHTGTVGRVNDALLRLLLDAGHVPVLTPPGAAEDGTPINVDGDRAAAAVAVALGARALVFLSDVPGVLRDPGDPCSKVAEGDPEGLGAYARGRMRTKLQGARKALDGGVPRVVLAEARGEHPVGRALAGHGTVVRDAPADAAPTAPAAAEEEVP